MAANRDRGGRGSVPPAGSGFDGDVSVVPANKASWEDLQAIFGARGYAQGCQCQWFQTLPGEWRSLPWEERAERLREQTGCGHPRARATSGLVAYVGAEPAGWCSVGPRALAVHLRTSRVPWAGREEDPDEPGVWAVTCFVTRLGYRRRGLTAVLTAAAVDFARAGGARALEAYPMVTQPGIEVTWGELNVGSRGSFADAGFEQITAPTRRRVVMRRDFGDQ